MHPHASPNGNHALNLVDEAGKESFPASDPPAFTAGASEIDQAAERDIAPPAAGQPPWAAAAAGRLTDCCPPALQRWGLLASTAALGFVVGRLLTSRR